MDLYTGFGLFSFNSNELYDGMELHRIFDKNKEIKAQFHLDRSYCGWLIIEIVRVSNVEKRSDVDDRTKQLLLSRVRCFRFTNRKRSKIKK